MPPTRRRLLPLLLILAACGDDAESAPPEPAPLPAAGASTPWDSIPPDSLYGATAVENLSVAQAELELPGLPDGWNGMRIAALSDLQLGLWPDNEPVAAAAVRRALALRPDLVVLLGDYVRERADTAALARVLAPLRGRTVLAVLGDGDVRSDSLAAAVTRTLGGLGIRVLRNDAAPVGRGADTAFVAGVDPELVPRPLADREYVLATLGGSARVPILLTHVPQLVLNAPEARYAVVLAGNTFCGRVEVPGTPRLAWLRAEAMPGAVVEGVDRLFQARGATLLVTCGTGYTFVPVRLGAPPELLLLTLRGTGPAEAAQDTAAVDSLLRRLQKPDTAG